jgi:hypothetical protein
MTQDASYAHDKRPSFRCWRRHDDVTWNAQLERKCLSIGHHSSSHESGDFRAHPDPDGSESEANKQMIPRAADAYKGVFRCLKLLKILQDSSSHQIFRHMHGTLNISKKIINYIVWL